MPVLLGFPDPELMVKSSRVGRRVEGMRTCGKEKQAKVVGPAGS